MRARGGDIPTGGRANIQGLSDDLLLRVFEELGKASTTEEVYDTTLLKGNGLLRNETLPFRTMDYLGLGPDSQPGLRSYPFLGQVCRRWNDLLKRPSSFGALWKEVVIDFGHELITSVHTPIEWSDKRPNDNDFRESFAKTQLNSSRILSFVNTRASCIRSLRLVNSEGYYSEDGDFVNLQNKHNFTLGHLGMLLGLLSPRLTELCIGHCTDFFVMGNGALPIISCLPMLTKLCIDDLHCSIDKVHLAELGRLTKLERLSIVSQPDCNTWAKGIDALPEQWSALTNLQELELRGHAKLPALPKFLHKLALMHLDLSYCPRIRLAFVSGLTTLRTLAIQGNNLGEADGPMVEEGSAVQALPNLEPLCSLTALNLSENRLNTIPASLTRLTDLRYIDLATNRGLKVTQPLTPLLALTRLRLLDLRGCHEEHLGFWGEEKCNTMNYISAFARIQRRKGMASVLHDMS